MFSIQKPKPLPAKEFMKKWKKEHINYFEVIILPNGDIVQAVPSHQEFLISYAVEVFNTTREDFLEGIPLRYHFDMIEYLTYITDTVSVWRDGYIGNPSLVQWESLQEASMHDGGYINFEFPPFIKEILEKS